MLEQSRRDKQSQNVIRAIREERARRRATQIGKMFHAEPSGVYVWDNMGNGPYAGYNDETKLCAVDVLGLMHELGYCAARLGAEAKVLVEADKELRRTTSERKYTIDPPHLQMLVALVHRIIADMESTGELRKVNLNGG